MRRRKLLKGQLGSKRNPMELADRLQPPHVSLSRQQVFAGQRHPSRYPDAMNCALGDSTCRPAHSKPAAIFKSPSPPEENLWLRQKGRPVQLSLPSRRPPCYGESLIDFHDLGKSIVLLGFIFLQNVRRLQRKVLTSHQKVTIFLRTNGKVTRRFGHE